MLLRDRLFLVLERADEWLHARGLTVAWFCRMVGRMEPGFYNRTTDWENPIYFRPKQD